MAKCHWSGNPLPQDSFTALATAKNNQKTSRAAPIAMKPKHPDRSPRNKQLPVSPYWLFAGFGPLF
jgi:hypothetical protein